MKQLVAISSDPTGDRSHAISGATWCGAMKSHASKTIATARFVRRHVRLFSFAGRVACGVHFNAQNRSHFGHHFRRGLSTYPVNGTDGDA